MGLRAALLTCSALTVITHAAHAQTVNVGADTTISTSSTGDPAPGVGPEANGLPGGSAVNWTANNVDVILSGTITLSGANGGAGGPDTGLDGGSDGGIGAFGLNMGQNAGSVIGAGATIQGGNGFVGSAGGTLGVNDTNGGNGGAGAEGIRIFANSNSVQLTNTDILGGNGAQGGAAGNAPGDAANTATGGSGGNGGSGIFVAGGTGNLVLIGPGSNVTGGNGANGGLSLANATNASGGNGGTGIDDNGTNTVVTINSGASVQGGDGGLAGLGGSVAGTLGLGGYGVRMNGTNGILTNFGTITSGLGINNAYAVLYEGTQSHFTNHGTVGGNTNTAFRLDGAATMNDFDNNPTGLIYSTGATNTTVLLGGTMSGFTNSGTITNTSNGLTMEFGGTMSSTWTNNGTISANNNIAINITNAGVASLFQNGFSSDPGLITNNSGTHATIDFDVDMGAGGWTINGGPDRGTVSNTFATGRALYFDIGQAGTISVENSTIVGSIWFNAASESLVVEDSDIENVYFDGGGTNTIAFGGTGTTSMTDGGGPLFLSNGGGTVDMILQDTATVDINSVANAVNFEIDTLNIQTGTHLRVNEDFGTSAVITHNGTLTIASDKDFLYTNAAAIAGTGTYVFKVGTGGTVGYLGHTTSAIDFTGDTVQILVDNPAISLANGTELLIAAGPTTATGLADGTVLTDDSALMNFTAYRGDNAEITTGGANDTSYWVQVAISAIGSIFNFDNPNIGAVGGKLDEIQLGGDADVDGLYNDVLAAGSQAEVEGILATVIPPANEVAVAGALDFAVDTGDTVEKHLALLDDVAPQDLQPAAGGDDNSWFRRGARWWAGAFGKHADQDARGFADGYDATSYGVVLGRDNRAFDDNGTLGIAFSYGHTSGESEDENSTDTDVDSYQATLYGDYDLGSSMKLEGVVAYSYHDTETARHNVGGVGGPTATADYGAHQVSVRGKIGKDYGYKGVTVSPHVKADYAHYNPDSYTEEGAGGLGLEVEGESLNVAHAGVGVDVAWDLKTPEGHAIRPEVRVGYSRDLTQEKIESSSSFVGAPGFGSFKTQGEEPAANILTLGASVTMTTSDQWMVRADYDFEAKEDYSAHSGFVRASYKF